MYTVLPYTVPLLCRTDLIFGNLEEIWEFHADTLLPQLESCHLNPTLIAKTFLEYCQHLTRMYCRSVVNQEYLTVWFDSKSGAILHH